MFNRRAHVHKEKTKGRDNTLGRHCANRARHTMGARQNIHSAWFSKHTTWTLGFSTRHAWNTLISSTEKFGAQSFPHGTSWQQQWDRELKKTQQVETRFKTRQFQHAPSPGWARSPNCVQFFKSPSIRWICPILPRLQIWDREQTRRLLH